MPALRVIFPDTGSLTKLDSCQMGALTKANIVAKSWKFPGLPGTYIDIVYRVTNLAGRFPQDQGKSAWVLIFDELYNMLSTL